MVVAVRRARVFLTVAVVLVFFGLFGVASAWALTLSATVSVGDEPRGVAVSPDSDTVYVTNFADDTVSVINASTNAVTATVSVGDAPDGVAVSPDSDTVYVTNFADDTVSVINASTNAVTATVSVGDAPDRVAVSPCDTVYVANPGSDTVSVLSNTSSSCDSSDSSDSSENTSVPGIYLCVAAGTGDTAAGTTMFYGSYAVAPRSPYTLTLESTLTQTTTTLASGVTSADGHFEAERQLPALTPGLHKLVFTGYSTGGTPLTLTNHIRVSTAGTIVSVSPESSQPTLQ